MVAESERLERLITDEVGECCDGDVEERVGALRAFAEETPADVDGDLTALKTLGDETRHRIARLLAAAERDLCVCELSPVLDVSDSAISHALSDLHEAGLVTRRKDGNWRYYGASDRTAALLDALDDTREVVR
jgi:ArsR family transcriptional regulator